jgi:hypothetical protein
VALFFLSAGLVFILARWFGLRTKHEGTFNPEGKIKPEKEPVSLWPPLMALGLILLLALIFAIYNGLMLAQLARNKDEIPQIIMWLSWLREHQANELIGGALAGIILHEGFRRTQEMSASLEGALKNSAIVILPAVLFLAVALLSREGVLERITDLEAGGVKVTMQPLERASQRDDATQGQHVTGPSGESHQTFPNIVALKDLVNGGPSQGLIERDLEFIARLAGRNHQEVVPAITPLTAAHRDFLVLFRATLSCLEHYVSISRDTRLVAIAGVDVPLGFVVLNRAITLRKGQSQEPTSELEAVFLELLKNMDQLRGRMYRYMDTFLSGVRMQCVDRPEQVSVADNLRSQDFSQNNNEKARHQEIFLLRQLWGHERKAPYIALAATWLGAAYKEPGMAARLLTDWLQENPRDLRSSGTADVALAWFRVRTLVELLAILPSTFGRPEPASARAALQVTFTELENLPGLPSLERYTLTSVRGKAGDCPKIHEELSTNNESLSKIDARLYFIRTHVLARLLHAVVDNPDPTNRLNAQHLRLATALKDADPTCLPENFDPEQRRAWVAVFQITYARVARAWAAEDFVSREQARDLLEKSKDALRIGLNDLEALHSEWRRGRDGNSGDLGNLFNTFPFQPILETTRRLPDAASR